MTNYDVFNGDADGICALQQLRLIHPRDSTLVTGVKRDVRLLDRVFPSRGDSVTVLDLSLDTNRTELMRILSSGANVTYFDHHFSGQVPTHERLETHIETSRNVCTSLLVDEFLDGEARAWAIVGAFGDSLDDVATRVGAAAFDETRLDQLRELGQLLNYNSYGRTVTDLRLPPDDLFRLIRPYRDPLDFLAAESVVVDLREGFVSDLAKAANVKPEVATGRASIYVLPDEAWARRISGAMANDLRRRWPDRCHAIVVPNTPACYVVSVRVSDKSPVHAGEFCRQFDSGGGRATAGGINHLPRQCLDDFLRCFQETFS